MVETKRRWIVIFETRDIEDIRKDYLASKWQTKEEIIRLKEWETQEFIREYNQLKNYTNDLMESFNMNALQNYQLLERKFQGNLKK